MSVTRATDYAARALIHLATLEVGAIVSHQAIAKTIQVPARFTGKILQHLVAAGFVTSTRGKRGGFCLTPHGRGATLFDVLVAIEGPVALNDCVSPDTPCARAPFCSAHAVWRQAQGRVVEALKAAQIGWLAEQSARLQAGGPQEDRTWATG